MASSIMYLNPLNSLTLKGNKKQRNITQNLHSHALNQEDDYLSHVLNSEDADIIHVLNSKNGDG